MICFKGKVINIIFIFPKSNDMMIYFKGKVINGIFTFPKRNKQSIKKLYFFFKVRFKKR